MDEVTRMLEAAPPPVRIRIQRSMLLIGRAFNNPSPNQAKLRDFAKNRSEYEDLVWLSNTFVRGLVSNAQEAVRPKLLTQFETWFKFVLDAQEELPREDDALKMVPPPPMQLAKEPAMLPDTLAPKRPVTIHSVA